MTGLMEMVSDVAVNLQMQEQTVIDVTNYVAFAMGVTCLSIFSLTGKMYYETRQILNRPSEQLDLFYSDKR